VTAVEVGTRIDLDNLPALSLGCTVFAGGGGGDPRIGELMAMEAIHRLGPVEVLPRGGSSARRTRAGSAGRSPR
jgi:DUF917 family protein